tara:strand:- start:215 stop:1705 length:1491 start_codon:yes stop_codon:yes gene_type:complete
MSLLIHLLIFCFATSTEVPTAARQALNALPEKKVTLSVVLNKSIESSDSFQILQTKKQAIPLAELYSSSSFDLQMQGSYGLSEDSREMAASIMPSDIESESYNLTFSKYLSSGTSLSLTLDHGSQAFNVASTDIPEYFETKTEFRFSQSLWRDAFGLASRNNYRAGQIESQATKKEYEKDVQVWAKDVGSLFYSTWLAQAQVKSARTVTALRKRLLNISRKKLQRGTTEQPDFLQIEASYMAALSTQEEAEEALQEAWQRLVVLVKLPLEWLDIDASIIPMSLDEPSKTARLLCETQKQVESYALKELEAKAKAARLKDLASENLKKPDIQFTASIASNGIENDAAEAISEAGDYEHDQWFVGLSFSYPLENSKAKADAIQANIERKVWEARYQEAKANLDADWISRCNDLRLKVRNWDRAMEIAKKQRLRARLEEKRFSIGKSNVLQMVQAGNDLAQSEFNLNQAEIALREAAWQVMDLSSQVRSYLQGIGVQIP